MKRPVRYSRKRVQYTGRLDRAAFLGWSESADGRSVLEPIASRTRFALFGKLRVARRRVWRELNEAARSGAIVEALQHEVDAYFARLDTLVFANELPRVAIDLHRLVVVPRVLANAETDRRIDAELNTVPAFSTQNGRTPLRDWFTFAVIDGIEAAVVEARPSPKQPWPAGDGWIIVGVNDQFDWRVPFRGPAWPGHYYVFELTRDPITRAVRKTLSETIERIEASLPALPRARRDDILKHAGLSVEELLKPAPALVSRIQRPALSGVANR